MIDADVKTMRESAACTLADFVSRLLGISMYEMRFVEARKAVSDSMHARILHVVEASSKQKRSEELLKQLKRDLEAHKPKNPLSEADPA